MLPCLYSRARCHQPCSWAAHTASYSLAHQTRCPCTVSSSLVRPRTVRPGRQQRGPKQGGQTDTAAGAVALARLLGVSQQELHHGRVGGGGAHSGAHHVLAALGVAWQQLGGERGQRVELGQRVVRGVERVHGGVELLQVLGVRAVVKVLAVRRREVGPLRQHRVALSRQAQQVVDVRRVRHAHARGVSQGDGLGALLAQVGSAVLGARAGRAC
mmetsp:Transcript_32821/g.83306  ORF Transcript_32821/g.83306 Transcript_32821/m.83306 type:complete len:214 (-) Transcript_32821:287-928(-)